MDNVKTKIQDNLWPEYFFNKYKLIESMDKFAKAKIQDKNLLGLEVIKGTLR
jgi:hypothetical protein